MGVSNSPVLTAPVDTTTGEEQAVNGDYDNKEIDDAVQIDCRCHCGTVTHKRRHKSVKTRTTMRSCRTRKRAIRPVEREGKGESFPGPHDVGGGASSRKNVLQMPLSDLKYA